MKRFGQIVLSIPHSSTLMPEMNGWEDCDNSRLNELNTLYTDVATDLLFKPISSLCNNIRVHTYLYSRLYCDVERLVNDPMEKEGLGIAYSHYMGLKRHLTEELVRRVNSERAKYLANLCLSLTENDTLLIDCHSFTPNADNRHIDFCIGFNDDWSKPDDETLNSIRMTFENSGYRVAFNAPYSNSITPLESETYKSVMIEVNKNVYLEDDFLTPSSKFVEVNKLINQIYSL